MADDRLVRHDDGVPDVLRRYLAALRTERAGTADPDLVEAIDHEIASTEARLAPPQGRRAAGRSRT